MRLYWCDCALEGARLAITRLEAFAPLNGLVEPSPPRPVLPDANAAASLNEDGAHAIAFWLLAPLLLLAGTLLGAIGSGVTMRRFLRV